LNSQLGLARDFLNDASRDAIQQQLPLQDIGLQIYRVMTYIPLEPRFFIEIKFELFPFHLKIHIATRFDRICSCKVC
jgi:hypothetical protein